MYPKARLDALSDGIFAVAMTLLVLDVRLPDDFQPRDGAELLHGLSALEPKVPPYALSFAVLGLRWLSNIQFHARGETLSRGYCEWWLFYHLLITCVPFTTIILGRYPDLAPSVWLYAGNTILISAVAFRMLALTPPAERVDHARERRLSLIVLIGSSLLAIGWSFVSPRQALWALALNLAVPSLTHRYAPSRPAGADD